MIERRGIIYCLIQSLNSLPPSTLKRTWVHLIQSCCYHVMIVWTLHAPLTPLKAHTKGGCDGCVLAVRKNLYVLVKICCTIPATSCECEGSASAKNIEVIERVIRSDVITPNETHVHLPSMLVDWKKSKSNNLNSDKEKLFSFNFWKATREPPLAGPHYSPVQKHYKYAIDFLVIDLITACLHWSRKEQKRLNVPKQFRHWWNDSLLLFTFQKTIDLFLESVHSVRWLLLTGCWNFFPLNPMQMLFHTSYNVQLKWWQANAHALIVIILQKSFGKN